MANRVGVVKQIGIDSTQSMVLVVTRDDGTDAAIRWSGIKKIGEIVLLGGGGGRQTAAAQEEPGGRHAEDARAKGGDDDDGGGAGKGVRCGECSFENSGGSKFCEECGTRL